MPVRSMLVAALVSGAFVPGGRAADTPLFLSAPAQQAVACGALGEGLSLPGTATCVRVHGSVWVEVGLGRSTPSFAAPQVPPASGPIHQPAISSLLTTGRVSLDARTPTAYGPVRVYLSVKDAR